MKDRIKQNGVYLSTKTVADLNDIHGWFQYGDAQSDVSIAFANNAVHCFLEAAKNAEILKNETNLSPLEVLVKFKELQKFVKWIAENPRCHRGNIQSEAERLMKEMK